MSSSASPITIAVILVVFAVLVVGGVLLYGRMSARALAEIKEELGADNILWHDEKAIYYGKQSLGALQPREYGGVLALTRDALHYRTMPHGAQFPIAVTIPFGRVRGTRLDSSFMSMGFSVVGGLLIVEYEDESGEPDAIAWNLKDREQARREIERLAGIDTE